MRIVQETGSSIKEAHQSILDVESIDFMFDVKKKTFEKIEETFNHLDRYGLQNKVSLSDEYE